MSAVSPTDAFAGLWRLAEQPDEALNSIEQISVAMRDAAIEFRSERYMRVDGKPADES
jgi:hypothetical protein